MGYNPTVGFGAYIIGVGRIRLQLSGFGRLSDTDSRSRNLENLMHLKEAMISEARSPASSETVVSPSGDVQQ